MLGIPVVKLAVVGVVGVAVFAFVATGGKRPPQAAADQQTPTQCQFTVNADLLNVRSGPGTSNPIVGGYPHAATLTATTTVQNNFRKIDDTHWVSGDYLQPAASNKCQ